MTRMKKRKKDDAELAIWPRLSFWFPGLTPDVLARTPRAIQQVYLDQLPGLVAEVQAMMIQASMYPHIKPVHQKSISAQLKQDIEESMPQREEVQRPSSIEETASIASSMGFDFIIVEPEDEEDEGEIAS